MIEHYICANCKFKFKASKMPNTCPYCNKNTVEQEKNADDLVNEIEDLLK